MVCSLVGPLCIQQHHLYLWPLCLVFQFLRFASEFDDDLLNHLQHFVFISELKRRLKAEKKAAEKEAKTKEQPEQEACKDEETLDPNVRFIFY